MSDDLAYLVTEFGSKTSDDQAHGFFEIKLQREMPGPTKHFWLAIPASSLPAVAGIVLDALPKAEAPNAPRPLVFETKDVALGDSDGRIIFTVTLASGGSLSVWISEPQARALAQGFQNLLGDPQSSMPDLGKAN
jgi:hypothetical protein